MLLVFSAVYAGVRTLFPRRRASTAALRGWHLAVLATALMVASWLVRFAVPLGEEVLALKIPGVSRVV